MDVFEAIKTRRSIRRFSDRPVSNETIIKVIQAATFAPSAHNKQPWGFIVVTEKEKLKDIADVSKYAKFLPQASVAIVVCADFSYKRNCPDERGLEYFSVQDSAAAVQNMLLTARGLELGSCWIGDFNEKQLRPMFEIPSVYNVVAIIALGYPETDLLPMMPPRKSLEEVIHWYKWDGKL